MVRMEFRARNAKPSSTSCMERGKRADFGAVRGKHLSFVDGPEDDFWSNVPSVDTENSFHIGWVSWPNMEFSKFPVLMNVGMDGYYFDFDISAYYADLF